ncbi:MAG: TonB family protein [Candidatus Omnitrophica bacterium]|nr:TonB family protein [Candidatus Omnitrophota bacterium]MDD5670029.1 TonB family protein [Candidatus Omnitrophota bacterium]
MQIIMGCLVLQVVLLGASGLGASVPRLDVFQPAARTAIDHPSPVALEPVRIAGPRRIASTPPHDSTRRVTPVDPSRPEMNSTTTPAKDSNGTKMNKLDTGNPAQSDVVLSTAPILLKKPALVYPRIARQKGWQGIVVLKVDVDENGLPSEVQVKESSGHSVLDKAAYESAKKTRFLPVRILGRAYPASVTLPIRFVLKQDAYETI